MLDINSHIDKVSEKFSYDEELKGVLKRIVPLMAEGKEENQQQLLLDTLDRVKIFVLDKGFKKEDVDKCEQEIMGEVNNHVTFEENENGEYGKNLPDGAYVSSPVFDKNMNLIDRKAFIYVSKLGQNEELSKTYGTQINLSHLVHELGHGWASQHEEYVQDENKNLITKIGAARKYSIIHRENNEVSDGKVEGLFVEESLNTLEEERVLCNMLGIQSINELESKGYLKSNYQGLMSDMMREYVEKFKQGRFDDYRIDKDDNAISDIEDALRGAEDWETMHSARFNERKKEKFNAIENLEVPEGAKQNIRNTFSEYENVFFPDNSNLTPMQKLDNVFEQIYNFGMRAKYNFGIMDNEKNKQIYSDVAVAILAEGYVPLNQAKELPERKREVQPKGFLADLQSAIIPLNEQPKPSSREMSNKSIESKDIEL